jgi:hypothetical protein
MSEEQGAGSWRDRAPLLAGAAATVAAVAGLLWLATRSRATRGTKRLASGALYDGDLVDGHAQGRGTSRAHDGTELDGEWKWDVPHGRCTVTFANGRVFVGEVVGTWWKGTFRNPRGAELDFVGRSEDGSTVTGQAVMRAENGEVVFRGNLVDNLPDGEAVMQRDEDGLYEGAMRKGQRHGHGRQTGLTGDVYEGDWEEDTRHGSGCMRYDDGRRYEGTWRRGQWQDGVLHRPDGRSERVVGRNISL